MSGLDKIAEEIRTQAQSAAAQTTAQAEAQAASIREKAGEECLALREKRLARAKADAEALKKAALSGAEMEGRQALLAAKQEMIGEVLQAAKKTLAALPAEEYAALLLRLIEQNALPQKGEILLAEGDLQRLPSDFAAKADAAAQKAGGSLTLSAQSARIADGFVLVYGGIEENCSLDALFSAKSEVLQDTVHKVLFC